MADEQTEMVATPAGVSLTGLTDPEAMLVWNALMELPGKITYALVKKLEVQLRAQGKM